MKILVGMMVFVFLFTGCAAKFSDAPGETESYMPVPAAPPMAEDLRESQTGGGVAGNAAQPERLVIRNADLRIVVTDPADVVTKIGAMAESMGGFVVSSKTYQSSTASGIKYKDAMITIRVPADKLQDALTQIKANVKDPQVDVLSETVSGEDVTAQYTDLKSRLKNQEAAATQLNRLMEEAKDPDTVVAIFTEMNRINEEIEVLKGQIKYYEESAALSAITVTLKAEQGVAPITIGGWEPKGVAKDALQALINAYQEIASGAIWLVIFCLPIAIPVALVIWLIVRAILKARGKSKAKNVETKAEVKTQEPSAQ